MRTLFPLFILLCFLVNQPAQAQADKGYVYTIHVGAYINPRPADFDPIRPYGFLYGKSFDYNLLRIYLGDFRQEGDAKKILTSVKANGFSDAYVTKLPAQTGKQVPVVQVATKLAKETIDWDRYANGSPIQVLSLDGVLKITYGPYPSTAAANAALPGIRSGGFSDAFVKNVNPQLLHPITLEQVKETMVEGQAGNGVTAPEDVPEAYDSSTRLPNSEEELTEKTPLTSGLTAPPAEPIPASYDEVMTLKSPTTTIALPKIRAKVKRNSAYELQKVLKVEGTYKGSLDGYYGKGTTAGYDKMLTSNAQLIKYRILSENTSRPGNTPQKGSLQYAINQLLDQTPQAMLTLEQSNQAIAKAYRAYVYFDSQGPSVRADQLMNDAIQQAFNRKDRKNNPPFDFRSTYTYKDINQLILHLRHIQAAEPQTIAAPCWLFAKHPKAAAAAYETGSYFAAENYAIEACDQLLDWSELALLETIAEDLNPSGTVDKSTMKNNAYKRSRLLLLDRKLSPEAGTAAEEWHKNLWKGLDSWALEDLLHQKLVVPLRVAYFQSMVRLEDHFMDRGQQPKMARQLAIATLQTTLEPHLNNYVAQP